MKIQKLFVWDDCIDFEAITTLSMLCQKKGMNSYFEYECKILSSMQGGKHKEIGVTCASSISTEQQEFLIRACLPEPSLSPSTNSVIIIDPMQVI